MNSNNKAITSVSEFITEIERHYSDGKEYFFRGESKDYVTIIPNLYREPTWLIKDSTDYYKRLSIELGLKNTDSISVIDQMATLQHYGAKSRLLDITSNALIALFFAVENTAEEKNGIVRVFNGKVFFDSGHTIAAKTAANFMDISLIKNFYKYCHDFLNSQEFLKNIREAIIQCSTYGNGLKCSNDLNNVEPYPINNSANVIAELRHMTTSEMMKKMPSFDLIDFMEKLNQITKTRERLNKPLAIFFDMHLPQIYLSTFSNDRIKRQQGAFITPPILGGGDRDNPEEVNTLYKAKVKKNFSELKSEYENLHVKNKLPEHLINGKLSSDNAIRSETKSSDNEKDEKLSEVYQYVKQLNYELSNQFDDEIKELRNKFLQLLYDMNYSGYQQALTYSIKKLEKNTIAIDGKSKRKIKQTLNILGINEGTVYPDLEHISDSLIENLYSWDNGIKF